MPRKNRAIRNPVAQSPLLRKGGVHTQSKSGQRAIGRMITSSAIDEWKEETEENLKENENEGEASPSARNALNNPPQNSQSTKLFISY